MPPPLFCLSHHDGGGGEVRLGIWLGLLDLVWEKGESGAREVVPVVAGGGLAGRDSAAAGTHGGEVAGRAPSVCEFGDLGFTGVAVEMKLSARVVPNVGANIFRPARIGPNFGASVHLMTHGWSALFYQPIVRQLHIPDQQSVTLYMFSRPTVR
jgi:hypothetical protein